MAHADNSVRNKEIADRFASCDKNRDGKLTREEAKACMPRVYDHFSYLDSENKGFVTLAQIQLMASR
jgi:Ca2+-binding EF-hand superfamily protein